MARRLRRKKSFRRKGRVSKKRFSRSRKHRSRGKSSKVKSYRYGPKKPFGDVAYVTAKISSMASVLTTPGNQASVSSTKDLNNLGMLVTQFGEFPGIEDYARLFSDWRMTGLRIKLTWYANGTTLEPAEMFLWAGRASTGGLYQPQVLFEQPFVKHAPVGSIANTRPMKISATYRVKDLDPDGIRKGDIAYTGTTNLTSPYFNAPTETGGQWAWGVVSMRPTGFASSGALGSLLIEIWPKIKFWNRRIQVNV